MSSRLASTTLRTRTITRTAGMASARCSQYPKVKPVDRKTTTFATLDDSMMESPEKVLPSPTVSLAKSLSQHISSSTTPTSSLQWPVEAFVKALEEDRKVEKLCRASVFVEQQDKAIPVGELAEKEMWLKRFGGPGKMEEQAIRRGAGVMREIGSDGKGYLRVFI